MLDLFALRNEIGNGHALGIYSPLFSEPLLALGAEDRNSCKIHIGLHIRIVCILQAVCIIQTNSTVEGEIKGVHFEDGLRDL